MKTKFGSVIVALAIGFIASGFVSSVHADEKELTQLFTTVNPYSFGSLSFDDSYSLSAVDPLTPSAASLSFSPSAVPEPTTLALLAGGALALVAAKRRLNR